MKREKFFKGMIDSIPIALGYFAVSFSLGIQMKNIGMNITQGFLMSLLNNASAGEYAGIACVASNALLVETAFIIFITNVRYLLMSFSLSQKIDPNTPFYHRLLISFDITDELFGLGINYKGYIEPFYMYGAYILPMTGWSVGTAIGIFAGNIMPTILTNAFSVALFGMFIAIVIPAGKKDKHVMLAVITSFITSYLLSFVKVINESTRIIILTLVISAIFAYFFKVEDDHHE